MWPSVLSVSLHSVGLCAPARRPLGNLFFSPLLSHLLFRAPPDSVPQFVSLRAHLPAYPPCRPPSLFVRQALASLSLFLSLFLTLTVSCVNYAPPGRREKKVCFVYALPPVRCRYHLSSHALVQPSVLPCPFSLGPPMGEKASQNVGPTTKKPRDRRPKIDRLAVAGYFAGCNMAKKHINDATENFLHTTPSQEPRSLHLALTLFQRFRRRYPHPVRTS